MSGLHRAGVDEPQRALVELVRRRRGSDTCPRVSAGSGGPPERAGLDLVEPRVAADRERAAADDLHAVVGRRVVRGGHLEPALVAVLADREVEHLGADLAEIDDVGAGVGRAPDRGCRDLGRREAHVSPDRHDLGLERGDIPAGDCVCTVRVELVWHDSAHVVRLEHGGRQHRRMSLASVSIRPLQVRDADTLAALYTANREFLEPFDPPRPEGFATSASQRRELKALERERAADRLERFLIEADGEPAGVISVSRISRGPFQNAGLGYWVTEAMNGRGIATRAVGLVCEWGFGKARLPPARGGDARRQHRLADGAPPQRLHRDRALAQVPLHQRRLARPHPVRPHRRGLTRPPGPGPGRGLAPWGSDQRPGHNPAPRRLTRITGSDARARTSVIVDYRGHGRPMGPGPRGSADRDAQSRSGEFRRVDRPMRRAAWPPCA